MHEEAQVTINACRLNDAETMSLRVAVSSFRMELTDPDIRAALGEPLASGYDRHLAAVELLLVGIKR